MHREASRLRVGDGENPRDSGKHFFEARDFLVKVAKPGVRQAVDAGGTPLGGNSGLRFQPPLFEHALQRRVEGAFLNLQQVIGNLLDVLDKPYPCMGRARSD